MIPSLPPQNPPWSVDSRRRNHHPHSRLFEDSSSEYDLKAIPGQAVYLQTQSPSPPPNKRFKSSSASSSSTTSPMPAGVWVLPNESTSRPIDPTRSVVVVDSQENGIKLVHALMAYAAAHHHSLLPLLLVLLHGRCR